mmetsp:Transcript_37092/g.79114  ORF Transcript_37092/g.79114 Transcript_37092/m.79114 type:complete len:229 (+) Transcript_37092:1358-2044(+)
MQAACFPRTDPMSFFEVLALSLSLSFSSSGCVAVENASAMTALEMITKNPPTRTLTVLERHTVHAQGRITTPRLAHVTDAWRRTEGRFLPNVSMSVPTKGDRKSSIAAENAERSDRILTARAWGETMTSTASEDDADARWRVSEGRGAKTTMDVDATIRKDVWWCAASVLAFNRSRRRVVEAADGRSTSPPPPPRIISMSREEEEAMILSLRRVRRRLTAGASAGSRS